jgi:heat shock protein HspQ
MESRVHHLDARIAPPPADEPLIRASVAKFAIGQVVRHRIFPFRGVIFDVDPEFSNTEEWWLSIPEEVRPRKDQPFYHLLAENERDSYVAYVSEQNLLADDSGEPVAHPHTAVLFAGFENGQYRLRPNITH